MDLQNNKKMGQENKLAFDTKSSHLPRIMLIPNTISWILGTWSREIVKWNSHKYDFIIFPFEELWENLTLFEGILDEIDVVHCLSQTIFPKIMKLTRTDRFSHVKLVSSIHHIVHFSQVEECLSADKIMVVCKQFYNMLIANNTPPEKISLVYNGVDTEFFSPGNKSAAKSSLGIPKDRFTLGFSANKSSDHDNRKGIDIFLAALSKLSSQKLELDVIVTGPGWDDIINNQALDGIKFHYFSYLPTKRMPDFYNSLDIFVVTARVEGGPVPPLEAMSCGTPIVSTPVGTIADYVTNEVEGFIVPIEDISATASAITYIHSNKELAEKFGRSARNLITKNLSWEKSLSRIDALYGFSDTEGNSHHSRKMKKYDYGKLSEELMKIDEIRWQRKMGQLPFWKNHLMKIQKLLRRI